MSNACPDFYNPYNGDHHYTTQPAEYDTLAALGWRKEDIVFYSDDAQGQAVYRLFNGYQTGVGAHLYTTNASEYHRCEQNGWVGEKIGWYALADA